MLTISTAPAGPEPEPAFIGNIYGPLASVAVCAAAPPLFIALAVDDPPSGNGVFGPIEKWRGAERPVEFIATKPAGTGSACTRSRPPAPAG